MINWTALKLEKKDIYLISKIVDRLEEEGLAYDSRITMMMDLEAVHGSACQLDLVKLLESRLDTLIHDTHGIGHNLNRETGELENFFLPRTSLNV